jgi:hypothetical protein
VKVYNSETELSNEEAEVKLECCEGCFGDWGGGWDEEGWGVVIIIVEMKGVKCGLKGLILTK